MNYNHFEREAAKGQFSTYSLDKFWRNGIFINVKNNYWADPSGPNDYSGADGLQNRRGQGVTLVDGFDYMPFIGGTSEPLDDAIHIQTEVIYPPPPIEFEPGMDAVIKVTADKYRLRLANTGKIITWVRDPGGYVLSRPDTTDHVSSQETSISLLPVNFKIPEGIPYFTIEAELVPDGGFASTMSNVERFTVKLPPSSLKIRTIKGVPGSLIPGNKYTATIVLDYTLVTSSPTTNGTVEIYIKEYHWLMDKILKDYPLITVAAPPGTNKTLEKEITLDPSLEYLLVGGRYIELAVTLKDDAGAKRDKASSRLTIDHLSNSFTNVTIDPARDIGGGQVVPAGRKYFHVGERPIYYVYFSLNIETQQVTNWQVWVSPVELLNKESKIIEEYAVNSPDVENLSTGFHQKKVTVVGIGGPIPPGVKWFRQYVRLVAPDQNLTVAIASKRMDVREPEQVIQKAIPVGSSEVSFTPVPVTLKFTSNQKAGIATAEEFAGQFGASSALGKQSGLMKPNASWYWKFIPLNKYWSVYDTLQDVTFSATLSITYNPATDFPNVPGFNEDSLVITGLNPLSGELEALPTTLNKTTRTVTTTYTKFFDTWVVASKQTVVVSVKSDMSVIPERFVLEQNYPNPFNPSTTFTFAVPFATEVSLTVFDVLGQNIVTIFSGRAQSGTHSISWYSGNLPTGVYFYRLHAVDFITTKKMMILK